MTGGRLRASVLPLGGGGKKKNNHSLSRQDIEHENCKKSVKGRGVRNGGKLSIGRRQEKRKRGGLPPLLNRRQGGEGRKDDYPIPWKGR